MSRPHEDAKTAPRGEAAARAGAARTERNQRAASSGVVRIRLTAPDEFDAAYIACLIREDPHIDITGGPAHYSGGRLYFTARVRQDEETR